MKDANGKEIKIGDWLLGAVDYEMDEDGKIEEVTGVGVFLVYEYNYKDGETTIDISLDGEHAGWYCTHGDYIKVLDTQMLLKYKLGFELGMEDWDRL